MPQSPDNLTTDLETELRAHIIAAMGGDSSGELSTMSLASLLIRWFNWEDRQVEARPRAVHESSELLASQELRDNADALAAIKHEITAGVDLTPRLSNLARIAYVPTAQQGPLRRRGDLDLLISDWGIHHLHLAHAPKRSGLLLFVVFRADDAYLLQLLPHGNWTNQSLIEIIVRNWPEAGLLMGPLQGAVGLAQTYGAADLRQLRQGAVSTFLEIDGGVYLPRGVSTAGTAIASAQRSNEIMWELNHWRQQLVSGTTALDELAHADGHEVAQPGIWQPYVVGGEFGFVEPTAQLRVRVGYL